MKHRIAWFVYVGRGAERERIRHSATMRGLWPEWDAECSCGWSTATGGCLRSYITKQVWYHKHIEIGLPINHRTRKA